MNEHPESLLGSASVDPDKVETVSHVDAMPQAAQDGGLGTQAREGEVLWDDEVQPTAWVVRTVEGGFVRLWSMSEAKAKAMATEWGLEAKPEALSPVLHPAAPSADKLRIAVEALEKARDRLDRIRWVREFYTDGKHIATVTKDDIRPTVEEIDRALSVLAEDDA